MTQPQGPHGPHNEPGSYGPSSRPGPSSVGGPQFGRPAPDGRPTAGGPVPPSRRHDTGHPPWVAWALIGVILIMLVVAGTWYFLSRGPDRSTPESTGKAFAQAVNDEDIGDVKELFCPDDLRGAQDLDFTDATRSDETFGARFVRAERNAGATNDIVAITQQGQTATLAWPMRQVDGKWEFCGTPVRR